MEDKAFTATLIKAMAGLDLSEYRTKFRGADYIAVTPKQIGVLCFGSEPNKPTATNIARSLQALCWERSAINGHLLFVMPLEEYHALQSARA